MFEIRHYLTADGRDLVAEWLRKLRDAKAKTAIEGKSAADGGGGPADASSRDTGPSSR